MSTTVDVVLVASATILRVHGDITGASEPVLMDAYAQAPAGTRSIVLDFGDLD